MIKLTESGEVERFKARFVAKGFKQIYGVDCIYTEGYGSVSRHPTFSKFTFEHQPHRQSTFSLV
jgi:hypothetical protein